MTGASWELQVGPEQWMQVGRESSGARNLGAALSSSQEATRSSGS